VSLIYYHITLFLYAHNSSSITHEGIKCPSLKCDRFLTLEDVRTLSKASIAPQKLTATEYRRIEVFIQDAQVLYSAPTDAIVYCSVGHQYCYYYYNVFYLSIYQLCFTYTVAAQMSTSAQQVMHQNCSQLLTIRGIQSRRYLQSENFVQFAKQARNCGRPNVIDTAAITRTDNTLKWLTTAPP
jgi:hypothetical protein